MEQTRNSSEIELLSSPSYEPESKTGGMDLKSVEQKAEKNKISVKITPKIMCDICKPITHRTMVFRPFESFMETEDTVQKLRKIFSEMKGNNVSKDI